MSSRKYGTQIVSIFGQCEAVAAEMMIEQDKATRIKIEDFPRGAPVVNDVGQLVRFAIIISKADRAEFEELIKQVRA